MELVRRNDHPVRCAVCHDILGSAAAATCEGCGTVLHVECRSDVGACPTLGCREAATRPVTGVTTGPLATSKEGSRTLAGRWTGTFGYRDGRRVLFHADLEPAEGERFRGRTTEPNERFFAFSPNLLADVDGQVMGEKVRFTKKYDGTGGASHAVVYEGKLSADGRTIEGRWSIGGCFFLVLATGPFQMRHVS